MSVAILGPCDTCKGEGRIAREDAGEVRACFSCNGFRKTRGAYGGAYKTKAMADKHGVPCRSCEDGTWTAPDFNPCYSCHYNPGLDVAVIHPGDTLPDAIGHCSNASREVAEKLAAEWEFIPMRFDRGMTWGESYLGLGSVYSVTDYGAAWQQSDAEVVARVRESLSTDRMQWTKIMDKDRVITKRIVIKITHGGYSVIGTVDAPMPMLPPTYTPEVLNREVA